MGSSLAVFVLSRRGFSDSFLLGDRRGRRDASVPASDGVARRRRLANGGPQLRHDVDRKQFYRSEHFDQRKIAKAELSDHVVDSGYFNLLFEERTNRGGAAGDGVAELHETIEILDV